MEKKETITGCLDISDEWWNWAVERTVENFNREKFVSEVVMKLISEVREEELGGAEVPVSVYEKKLILSGILIGERLMKKMVEEQVGRGILGIDDFPV